MKCKKCDNLVGNNFKFCNKCGESLDVDVKFKKNLDKKEDTENVDFFMVPTWRLVIFSILSFGFYSVYLFSKNFSAIKKR